MRRLRAVGVLALVGAMTWVEPVLAAQEPRGEDSASAERAVARLNALDLSAGLRLDAFPLAPNQKAKAQILSYGSTAIPPLLSTLRGMLDQDSAYFRQWREMLDRGPAQFKHWLERQSEADRESRWVLIQDCLELLGKLKSTAAVSLIARAIEQERDDSWVVLDSFHGTPSPPVQALIRIGQPAIPLIIEQLGNVYHNVNEEYGRPEREEAHAAVESTTKLAETELCSALIKLGDESTAASLEALLETKNYMGQSFGYIIRLAISDIRTPRYLR